MLLKKMQEIYIDNADSEVQEVGIEYIIIQKGTVDKVLNSKKFSRLF